MKFNISADEYAALPDALKSAYKPQGDGYQLQVEGLDTDPKKVKEFRDNNLKLEREKRELAAQMEKYKGIDPEEYARLQEAANKLRELEEKNQISAGNLEEVVAKRTETMRQDYDKRLDATKKLLDATTAERDRYKSGFHNQKMDAHLRSALNKAGNLKNGADNLLIREARELFTLDEENDTIASKDLYNDKGEPMTAEEWGKRMVIERPYLFEPAQGSGASGGSKGNGGANRGQSKIKVLSNPSPVDFGKSLEGIASGEVEVQTADE